ncbi:ABC transporter ATP-binding protein [Solicola gregarius]|uniref:ABC-type quaternary amine transporter n=1 Tax=Solicola gregarius TaxID=2908642 RepID=A0AA46TKH5_9ACTN|nr:betaine/proline/choline family ABC transporter ATP-binding protein [Solicola gregarius]UYM06999.1 betaine/proline/choline family ABC transporter ATP-binding protein [Solicola gregarius]
MDRIEDPMIVLDRVSKTYPGGKLAVDALDLEVAEGALVTLVGPSGCGKSTTLKMVNRLIEPTSGRILLDGDDVTSGDPVKLRRRIGYVIQQVGLFPHQDVRSNVSTVPDLLGWNRKQATARADDLLELVGLDPGEFGGRYPHQLSGGQRQRVGVARALAADPPVLLMDEPFGAVDPVVRARLQDQFLELQSELRKTVLLVTHDIEEAVKLGDAVAVFAQGGRIAQYDTPAAVLGAPADDFVAEFVGAERGLRRLAVTEIDDSDLLRAPMVRTSDTLAEARVLLDSEGARWAVVLDGDDNLRGWVATESLEGAGVVGDRARRMEAYVSRDAALKDALATMLRHDAGWVAVLDGDRLVGVLTPDSLHGALRRSVIAADEGVEVADIDLEAAGPLH